MFSLSPTRWLALSPALAVLGLLAGSCSKDGGSGGGSTPTPTPPTPTPSTGQVAVWLTTPDKSALLYNQPAGLNFSAAANSDPTIAVDTTQTYQTMEGFGYTLTGGSAYVLSQMAAADRATLLKELFLTTGNGIGISYLRVSIGASDLSSQPYTYDDSGTPDPTLANFSLAPDMVYFIPMLKEILAVNPNIKILGSPWTAPAWMKQGYSPTNPFKGGSLQTQYYDAYARYFVKYLQGMQAQGITLDAVTLQNEPLYGGNNPSMVMTGSEQATFIKNNVGPALRAAGLNTKIIAYDHNPDADGLGYVNTVLSDAAASAYVDGSAFHLYGGTIGALSQVHNIFPTKNVYFTEQWTQAPGTASFGNDLKNHLNDLEIGAPRNWSRNVLEWNLASDPTFGPHTNDGGCSQCLGAITIGGNTVTRNVAYYAIGHSSKFVPVGSVRVATNLPADLPNVAYKTPAGKRVLLVLNSSNTVKSFNIQYKGKLANTSLYAGSVATYVW
jgi:glucosylceramidase